MGRRVPGWASLAVGCAIVVGCATGTTDTGDDTDEDDGGVTSSGGAGPVGPGTGGAPTSTGMGGAPMTSSTGMGGAPESSSSVGGAPTSSSSVGGMAASSSVSSSSVSSSASSSVSSSSASSSVSSSVSSSSSGGCTPTNILTDGGFEAGPGGGFWLEGSTNFGTPICDIVGCSAGGGTGPATGTFWAWFGGVDPILGTVPEIGNVQQNLVIPNSTMATLEFSLEIPVCDSALDTFAAGIDGQALFIRDGADAACGQIGYVQHVVDVSAYADGMTHAIQFEGVNQAILLGPSNFFVDDIQLVVCL